MSSAFDGIGAKKVGGRWNSPGIPIVYCSDSLALAALESLVHFETSEAPPSMIAISAQVPENLVATPYQPVDLPEGWRRVTGHDGLINRGDRWQQSNDSAALAVPSVVIPQEFNILLNPEHPDFERIQIGSARSFSFDRRLMATT